ncbi:hypothetical protein PAPYR_2200 [Paratrimastix pyriformis]|uniref:Uncharacterized protein n=1 Tax=Paratrimastix pyriformis TaxID=342808 RepID=A0ABQ8UU50_9EUKA|nr:hypothetical protein PAPYR_2200 [Paratrimastix pyriformis]
MEKKDEPAPRAPLPPRPLLRKQDIVTTEDGQPPTEGQWVPLADHLEVCQYAESLRELVAGLQTYFLHQTHSGTWPDEEVLLLCQCLLKVTADGEPNGYAQIEEMMIIRRAPQIKGKVNRLHIYPSVHGVNFYAKEKFGDQWTPRDPRFPDLPYVMPVTREEMIARSWAEVEEAKKPAFQKIVDERMSQAPGEDGEVKAKKVEVKAKKVPRKKALAKPAIADDDDEPAIADDDEPAVDEDDEPAIDVDDEPAIDENDEPEIKEASQEL